MVVCRCRVVTCYRDTKERYQAELYCTVLYCTVLYCTVLYCTALYCTAGTRPSWRPGRGRLAGTPGTAATASCWPPAASPSGARGASRPPRTAGPSSRGWWWNVIFKLSVSCNVVVLWIHCKLNISYLLFISTLIVVAVVLFSLQQITTNAELWLAKCQVMELSTNNCYSQLPALHQNNTNHSPSRVVNISNLENWKAFYLMMPLPRRYLLAVLCQGEADRDCIPEDSTHRHRFI